MTEMYDYEKYGCPSKQPSVRGTGPRSTQQTVNVVSFLTTLRPNLQFYVYRHNSGLQAQSVLYYKESIDPKDTSAPKVLIDPNALSSDGTVSLGVRHSLSPHSHLPASNPEGDRSRVRFLRPFVQMTAFSKDGRYLAYGLSQSGSDWINGKVTAVAGHNAASDRTGSLAFER